MKSLYTSSKRECNKNNYLMLLAYVPCIATFTAVFINILPVVPLPVLLLSGFFAIINGTVEELFWRGVFVTLFPKNITAGYFLPTVLFGLWHIALYFSKDIVYQGGFLALVGGSLFMGLLWGGIVYKTKAIKVVTIAHIITNYFAFSGLIYDNWFA